MMYLGFDIGKRAHDAALLDGDGEISGSSGSRPPAPASRSSPRVSPRCPRRTS